MEYLVLVCRDGNRVTAGKWLPGKRLATAVLRQIEQAAGKEQTVASP